MAGFFRGKARLRHARLRMQLTGMLRMRHITTCPCLRKPE
ncbi:hypothetical protein PCLA_04f0348 [Pseudomonas citronellolis]|nr:hypothetical protein PCLA_04f0348 [Pseudomonas citronellolis]